MLLKILHCTGQPPPRPPAKSYLAPNANATEMEKFWSRLKSLSDNFFRNTLPLRYFNTIDTLFICLCTLCICALYMRRARFLRPGRINFRPLRGHITTSEDAGPYPGTTLCVCILTSMVPLCMKGSATWLCKSEVVFFFFSFGSTHYSILRS